MNNSRRPGLGILTLATPHDAHKAIGLALSVRASNPGVPIAVACAPQLRTQLLPYFDHVVQEQAGLKGFVHKVWLDRYTPFEETMFFDSDVLVFKSIRPYVERWKSWPYAACGRVWRDGASTFGMQRAEVLQRIGKSHMTVIDGAGHAYFRLPDAERVFERARAVTEQHAQIIGPIPYADEDVMDVVLTEMDIPPMPYEDFFSRYFSARPGTMDMDAARAHCRYIDADDGSSKMPCMTHFASNEAALPYHLQLWRLFRKHRVPVTALPGSCVDDAFQFYLRPRLRRLRLRLRGGK